VPGRPGAVHVGDLVPLAGEPVGVFELVGVIVDALGEDYGAAAVAPAGGVDADAALGVLGRTQVGYRRRDMVWRHHLCAFFVVGVAAHEVFGHARLGAG